MGRGASSSVTSLRPALASGGEVDRSDVLKKCECPKAGF